MSEGTVEITGLLSTVNADADRVAMHAVRRTLLEAQADRLGLKLVTVEIPSPCPNDVYEARMADAMVLARAERRHPGHLRRPIPPRRARLPRRPSRRNRHLTDISTLGQADGRPRGGNARDRFESRDHLRRPETTAGCVRRPGLRCRTAERASQGRRPMRRTLANSTPSSGTARDSVRP